MSDEGDGFTTGRLVAIAIALAVLALVLAAGDHRAPPTPQAYSKDEARQTCASMFGESTDEQRRLRAECLAAVE